MTYETRQALKRLVSEARLREVRALEQTGRKRGPKPRPIPHGTNAGYVGKAKCRCDLCRKAHTDYCREWKKRRMRKTL